MPSKWLVRLVIGLSAALGIIIALTLILLAIFLQSMFALTQEVVVAEVVMSPIQSDTDGDYITIEFTPLVTSSALASLVDGGTTDAAQTETYRIHGDTVAIRGPLVKLHNSLLVLNYSNIYKLALIEGEYRQSPGSGEGTEIPINGGFDASWWDLNVREATYPYNLIVDRVTFAGAEEPGFRGDGHKRYQIVVTMDTITWNFIEDLP